MFDILRHILTAAHCLQSDSAGGEVEYVWDDITVVLGEKVFLQQKRFSFLLHAIGEHDLSDDSETVTVVTKAKRTERKKHPKFFIRLSEGKLNYDVGLLELEFPIDFSQSNMSHIR